MPKSILEEIGDTPAIYPQTDEEERAYIREMLAIANSPDCEWVTAEESDRRTRQLLAELVEEDKRKSRNA